MVTNNDVEPAASSARHARRGDSRTSPAAREACASRAYGERKISALTRLYAARRKRPISWRFTTAALRLRSSSFFRTP
jgi:hypothetical protein